MNEPIINRAALTEPRNRRLLVILGAALLALLLILAIWHTSGARGAKRDLATANERVMDKQREVDDARHVLEQKQAELRALQANADVEATKLEGAVDQKVSGVVNDARLDPTQEYYIRDRDGRFVRVRP